MILFQNSLITIDYDPASDVLDAAYPDLHGYLLPEIKNTIDVLVDTVRNYDVKKVLLDSSRTIVSVSEEESREIAMYLAGGFMKTRVQKVARVISPSADIETRAQRNVSHIRQAETLPFQLLDFASRASALEWLQA